jgi:hypothetical protein
MVAFTEKVVAAEQGTSGGEKGKSQRLEAARDKRCGQGARWGELAPTRPLGGGQEVAERPSIGKKRSKTRQRRALRQGRGGLEARAQALARVA